MTEYDITNQLNEVLVPDLNESTPIPDIDEKELFKPARSQTQSNTEQRPTMKASSRQNEDAGFTHN